MKMFRKLLSAMMAATLLTTSVNLGVFAENSASDDSMEIHSAACIAEDSSEYGYTPAKVIDENGNEIKLNLKGASSNALKGTLPAKYSLLDKGYLPAIRHQGSEGTCWAHAGMAMAESNMIMSGLASASTVDFSEKHMAWFAIGANAPSGDPLYGDFAGVGAPAAYSDGGNVIDVVYTLMAWIGLEQEANVPYADFTTGVDESYRYHSYGHLQNANLYDDNDIDSIKQAIMRDGAVQIAYYANDKYLTEGSQNSAKFAAYYCSDSYTTNHSIVVVGWDDNFSKSNFKTGATPKSNGAWLCRNSWGSNWGTNGYFYMSYEDSTVGGFASMTIEPVSNYDKVYQYDGGCEHKNGRVYFYNYIYSYGLEGVANVFKASADDELSAVSFYTHEADLNYTVKIYTDLTGSTPDTGTLASAATVSGVSQYAGYHTVKLPKSVSVKTGTKFAVVFDMYDSEGMHYVLTDSYSPNGGLTYFYNGGWQDTAVYKTMYGLANARVKVYAKKPSTKPQNVKAIPGDGKVTLTWDKVEGATKYAIVSVEFGKYHYLEATCTGTSYTVTGLTNGTEYKFLVKAYVNDEWSPFTSDDYITVTPNGSIKPKNVKTTPGDGKVTLTWDKVTGATAYAIAIVENGKYNTLTAKCTDTSYTATNLTNGKKYTFLVQACVGGKWSTFTSDDYVTATPNGSVKPKNIKATAGDGKVTLTWDKVESATAYAIAIVENGKYNTLTTTCTATSYTATNLTNGKKYTFLVQAKVGGKWSSFTTSDYVTATPNGSVKPQNVKATAGNGKVTLTWDKVESATAYAIAIVENGKYNTLTTTCTGTSYTATNLTNGKKYTFLVQAKVSGKWSSFTTSDYVTATPNGSTKPRNVEPVPGNGQVRLSWDKVEGATAYAIAIVENGKYNTLTTTCTDTYYVVKNLTNGKKYTFLVQAKVGGKWSSFTTSDYVDATPNS